MTGSAPDPGERFRDRRERKYAYDFVDEVLVRCPRCDGCAVVLAHPEALEDAGITDLRRRLRCGACGYVKDETVASAVVGGPVDPFFRRPLWLRASCCGHVLWAYNVRHLDLLESYVAAKLRERGDVVAGAPASLVERLPTWLKTAKNRAEILRTIGRLRDGRQTVDL
ncbi:hypothetical protein SMD20_44340 [Nonomuraea sp. LP-02]|uniref:hypothetical protein n=1 Tax=Nonomuraea sp. LP-02 TaxID=3097960 RepID=UPI002E348670|nr:hypothetical protein [Nonomuraea sp. LP-02]MED7931315.1 hypothetical protein [Nonomuraea sp. LP-02]